MIWSNIVSILLAVCGVLLMFVILLQRGRGGGLAGAFGGLGGQSAFGTKAGDVFTRITIGKAIVWFALAAIDVYAMRWETQGRFTGAPEAVPPVPTLDVDKGAGKDADPFQGLDLKDLKSGPVDEKKDGPVLPGAESKNPAAPEKSETPSPEVKGAAPENKPAESKPSDTPQSGEKGGEKK
jgi:preprotein translocase subunit SecG